MHRIGIYPEQVAHLCKPMTSSKMWWIGGVGFVSHFIKFDRVIRQLLRWKQLTRFSAATPFPGEKARRTPPGFILVRCPFRLGAPRYCVIRYRHALKVMELMKVYYPSS